jgi:hypothetical protein
MAMDSPSAIRLAKPRISTTPAESEAPVTPAATAQVVTMPSSPP